MPRFSVSSWAAATLLVLTAGCGGGGSPDSNTTIKRCADGYSFEPAWRINDSLFTFQRLDGKVGEAFRATLELRNLQPAACVGLQSFQLGKGVVLPRGLVLDAATGTISGTPLEAKEIAGLPVVEVIFPGFGTGTATLTTLSITP